MKKSMEKIKNAFKITSIKCAKDEKNWKRHK